MKKKVLIVDDAAFMRMKIKRVLEPLDCELLEASNGQEGCMQFTSQPVDLGHSGYIHAGYERIGGFKGNDADQQ